MNEKWIIKCNRVWNGEMDVGVLKSDYWLTKMHKVSS